MHGMEQHNNFISTDDTRILQQKMSREFNLSAGCMEEGGVGALRASARTSAGELGHSLLQLESPEIATKWRQAPLPKRWKLI